MLECAPLERSDPDDPWSAAERLEGIRGELDTAGDDRAAYLSPPSEALLPERYKQWEKDLASHLYRHGALRLLECPELKLVSQPGESAGDFRVRLAAAAGEKRDLLVEKLRGRYETRFRSLEGKMRTAQERIAREKSQYDHQKVQTAISLGSSILDAFLSPRGRRGSIATTARGVGRAARERGDVKRAKENMAYMQRELADLEAEFAGEMEAVRRETDVGALELTETELAPRKSDINVIQAALVWLPWFVAPGGSSRPGFTS